jgi:MFS family permease
MALICFSATDSYWFALITFIPLGLGHAGRLTLSNTLLQSRTDDSFRGRVMSVHMMNWGITLLGVFIVGVLAEFLGAQLAVGGSAGLLALVTVYHLFFSSRIRSLD